MKVMAYFCHIMSADGLQNIVGHYIGENFLILDTRQYIRANFFIETSIEHMWFPSDPMSQI